MHGIYLFISEILLGLIFVWLRVHTLYVLMIAFYELVITLYEYMITTHEHGVNSKIICAEPMHTMHACECMLLEHHTFVCPVNTEIPYNCTKENACHSEAILFCPWFYLRAQYVPMCRHAKKLHMRASPVTYVCIHIHMCMHTQMCVHMHIHKCGLKGTWMCTRVHIECIYCWPVLSCVADWKMIGISLPTSHTIWICFFLLYFVGLIRGNVLPWLIYT